MLVPGAAAQALSVVAKLSLRAALHQLKSGISLDDIRIPPPLSQAISSDCCFEIETSLSFSGYSGTKLSSEHTQPHQII